MASTRRHACLALALTLVCTAFAPVASGADPFAWFSPGKVPARWRHLTLPDRGGVLSYPPSLHRVPSDAVSVSAAKTDSTGLYAVYLNATPKQGAEELDTWPAFRVEHLRDESATIVHEHTHAIVAFHGGTGSCVIDDYVTRFKAHHFDEIACLVVGRTQTSVVVAAALQSQWAEARAVLEQAVSAYQVR